MDLKFCGYCNRSLPASSSSFHRHAGRRDGWHDECRECRSSGRKLAAEKQRLADERTTIRRLAKLIREGQEVPEPDVIIRVAYSHFGGAAGVSRAMVEVLRDPKAPSMAKAGMLSAVCRLIPAADEARRRQEEENQRRVDGMSREELYERAADLERRLIQAVQAEMHE